MPEMWKNGTKAALTLSFDDCYKETCELTVELLAELGLRATYNVPTAYVGSCLDGLAVASWRDLRQAASKGMEIASHSLSHNSIRMSLLDKTNRLIKSCYHEKQRTFYLMHALRGVFSSSQLEVGVIDEGALINETAASRKELRARIPLCKGSSYTYPYGAYNSYYKFIVESAGYSSARSLDRGYNHQDSMDFFALKCMVWNQYMTLEVANRWVDDAIKKGGWLIETHHLVGEKNLSNYPDYISIDDFRKHLDYIMSKEIGVDSQQNIVRYMRERKASSKRI